MNEISLYIHIPFCLAKCNYCSFNSYPIKKYSSIIQEYFNALIKEINFLINYRIKTIYIGGGTPSIVNPLYIIKILNKIFKIASVDECIEITVEINPATINSEKLKIYKEAGINRISLGVQTFNNKLLKILGRVYSDRDIFISIELIKKYFENLSFDLIFGLPHQNLKDIENDIKFLDKIHPTHISYYSLSIEENTNFWKMGIKEVSDENFELFYNFICDNLEILGFNQYEISNFSRLGYQCIHNMTYWNYEEYIGIGAGAVSFMNQKRYKKITKPEIYIKNIFKFEEIEELSFKIMEFEYIFMNLRKTTGLNLKKFHDKFKINFFEKYSHILKKYSNFFNINNDFVSLNRKGFLISNTILSEFANI